MLITDKKALEAYGITKRLWQGIPGIAVTKGGRIFLTFYSGNVGERIGNYVVLVKSDDGVHFSEPVVVCYKENYRCFDPCVWIDPLDRLWLIWSLCPDHGAYAAICDDPDAEEICFGEPFFLGHDIMMNKPTVLSTGEWAFPIAVWNDGIRVLSSEYDSPITPKGSFMYVTADQGKTFQCRGYADVKGRNFDEHQFLEMGDGSIRVFVRCGYGIGAANSYDGGFHWSESFDTGYGGPSSRFYIGRLPSGRVLMINHYKYFGRNNLTAFLSDDDGKTFPHTLLLDERDNVSYPDVSLGADGSIYVVYDRERGGYQKSLEEVFGCAREVLYARITETDILQGRIVDPDSFLKRIAVKLTTYDGDMKNPFSEYRYFTDGEYAAYLDQNDDAAKIVEQVLDTYQVNCTNIHNVEAKQLDSFITAYKKNRNLTDLTQMISLVRGASCQQSVPVDGIIRQVCNYLVENLEQNEDIAALAEQFNFSACYLQHIFKKHTGTTIVGFKTAQRILKAKLLLTGCDDKIIDIAAECGFENASYFTEAFTKQVGMSPSAYRKLHRK